MNERIRNLREKSLNKIPYISAERAILLTDYYENKLQEIDPIPIQRAKAVKYFFENKKLYIGEGELIVGERGEAPKAVSTFPEIIVHSMQDLQILDTRPKIPYKVSNDVKQIYQDKIIPFWKGKAIRDKIFNNLDDEWKSAFSSGVFTEFMEQRAPGHTVLDDKIYHSGFKDFIQKIENSLKNLDFYNDDDFLEKRNELNAMKIVAEGLINFAKRYSKYALELAQKEVDEKRKSELLEISRICDKVPENKPETFQEALQYYWFVHIGVISELNPWDSFNPGRLDQHLYPFYKNEIGNNGKSKEYFKELLEAFWVKFNNHPAPPKVGVTAQESGTYTDFALINLGGVTKDGLDAVNEMTYLILEVIKEMRILQPSSMVQISKKNPGLLLKKTLEIVKTGFGQPSIFNTDAIIQEHLRQGKNIEDARLGGASGCVEAGVFGKESYILTGYFNLPKILEITLNNGVDPNTQKLIGLQTGELKDFQTYEEFYQAFEKQVNYFIDVKIKGNRLIERLYAKYLPVPFLSILIDDCILSGKDYNDGGARYNNSYIQGVGIGTITDSLASIKFNVFEKNKISLEKLNSILRENYSNDEILRQRFLNKTPKYGNDDIFADEILKRIFATYFKAVDGRKNTKGGHYRINLLPTTVHIYFGKVTGATPDGRFAQTPLSEGISPVQGADINGPSAVIKSAGKIDHLKTGGTLLNQKFTPQILNDEAGINSVLHLVRTYFRMDGHHIQFNVVTAETLHKAQKEPEKYKNLIVRVAGYSDYFVDLGEELQNEIIKRTEHTNF